MDIKVKDRRTQKIIEKYTCANRGAEIVLKEGAIFLKDKYNPIPVEIKFDLSKHNILICQTTQK